MGAGARIAVRFDELASGVLDGDKPPPLHPTSDKATIRQLGFHAAGNDKRIDITHGPSL